MIVSKLSVSLLFAVSLGVVVANHTTSKPKTVKPKTTHGAAQTTVIVPTTSAPTASAQLNCSALTTCSDCTKSYKCYWCSPNAEGQQCQHFPSGRLIPKHCAKNDWFWKQCVIPGYILIIVVPVVIGLFLLCCGCCIYCKCCKGSNKSWKKEEERMNAKRQERELKAQERKSERKKTTDALRMKYGLLKSDDEEQLIT